MLFWGYLIFSPIFYWNLYCNPNFLPSPEIIGLERKQKQFWNQTITENKLGTCKMLGDNWDKNPLFDWLWYYGILNSSESIWPPPFSTGVYRNEEPSPEGQRDKEIPLSQVISSLFEWVGQTKGAAEVLWKYTGWWFDSGFHGLFSPKKRFFWGQSVKKWIFVPIVPNFGANL